MSFVHDELQAQESLRSFVARERAAIGAFSLMFAATTLYMIFSVDPAYYYPRLITDQLLYFLKGLWFVQHGSTEARAAINVQPFVYAAGPGLLRAPWIAFFADFDAQIRAIQLSNVALAGTTAVLFAYLASDVLPQSMHKAAIGFSFLTQMLNPVWMTNIMSPLADLPFAAASVASVIMLRKVIAGTDEERRSRWKKTLCALFFCAAFMCRFTALAIPVYGWVLYRKRNPNKGGRLITPSRAAIAAVVAVLVLANLETLVFGYLWQPLVFLFRSPVAGMLLNAFTVSIPGALIPGLELLYRVPPVQNPFHPQFATNPFDSLLLVAGLTCTVVVVAGVWSARKMRRAELAYVLLPFPVLAVVVPSTTRYMLTYQPFIWVFFIAGVLAIKSRVAPSFRLTRRAAVVAASVIIVAGGAMLVVRSGRLTHARTTLASFSLGETRRHAGAVAATYRSLRRFLESLPQRHSLIVNARHGTGQWTAIAGVRQFQLDSTVTRAAATNDIYLVVDCPTPSTCRDLDRATAAEQKRFTRFGRFDFEKVFETATQWSAARVYLVRRGG